MGPSPEPHSRRLAVIAGAGRSGTSTLSGLLRILGMHVPQPEVVADETNPKGFGEPAWIVETHDRLLGRANVQVVDARPQAWQATERVAVDRAEQEIAAAWLARHLDQHPALVVKDPRMAWFLPLWREAASANDASLGFVTMLRPPAEVIGSRRTYYEPGRSPAHLAAGWLNALLHTEARTRGADGGRVFVRYADLLSDWETTVCEVDRTLGLGLRFTADRTAEASDFVDPSLRRVTVALEALELPAPLHELVAEGWTALNRLAEPGGESPETHRRLDELRAAYADRYRESEEMATSSIIAARREGRRKMRAQMAAQQRTSDARAMPARLRRAVGRVGFRVRGRARRQHPR